MIQHTIPPFYDENSTLLILGSFPSVASRESGFYYGHKQNRFWRVLAGVLGEEVPQSIEEKKSMLRRHHIALWDVIAQCDIVGSSDSSIKNVTVNRLSDVIEASKIEKIFLNGRKAQQLYNQYLRDKYGEAIYLPSTSAANAAISTEGLCLIWSEALKRQNSTKNIIDNF